MFLFSCYDIFSFKVLTKNPEDRGVIKHQPLVVGFKTSSMSSDNFTYQITTAPGT